MRLAVALAVVMATGCAVTSDIWWLASKPRQTGTSGLPEAPTIRGVGATTSRRYLDVDAGGSLVCIDEQRRTDLSPTVTTLQRTRNGLVPGTYGLAVMADAIVGFPILYGTAYFAAPLVTEDSDSRNTNALLAAGAITLLDMAWGTYRALTVKPTILERSSLSYQEAPRLVTTPCPVGTMITLQGETGTFDLQFGAGGRLNAELVTGLQSFTAGATQLNVSADANIVIELPTLRDLTLRLAPLGR